MTENEKRKQPLNTALIKGFFAGVIFSHINKRFMIGALIGTGLGMFAEQNFQNIPNVKEIGDEWISFIKSINKPKN